METISREVKEESPIIKELDPLFNPASVAVIGATDNREKWGYWTFCSIVESFRGRKYAVNISGKDVLGYKSYRRITEIPGKVDLAVFVIPAQNVLPVMEDCVEKGVKAAILITAGFQEIGEEGRKLQNEVVKVARKGGIRIVGPNCMGLWSASSNLKAFMLPLPVLDGPLGFVTQGGNVGVSILRMAYDRNIGFHKYVSCGATADLQIEDYIEYFGYDPKIKVVLAYIEGLNDGRRFMEKVRKIAKRKPIIVLKSGRTEAAAKAIKSHVGALAGSDKVYDSAFKEVGVIRVDTVEELLDVGVGFLTQPLPRGRNVAILTGGGSYGVICADACEINGLNVVKLPDWVVEELNKILPPRWSHGNPVDPAGDRNIHYYLQIPDILLRLEEVDSLIFMGFGGFYRFAFFMNVKIDGVELPENYEEFSRFIEEYSTNLLLQWKRKYGKPVVTTTFHESESKLKNGVYHYSSPERAVKVLAKLVEYKEFLEKESSKKL